MPLIAKACFAYALGLFVVIVLPAPIAALTIVAGLALGAMPLVARAARWSGTPALCATLYAAGALMATADRRAAASCVARLTAAPALHLVLDDDARAGGIAHAHVRESGCDLPVLVLVDEGTGWAGDRVTARGALCSSDRGLVLRDAILADGAPEARLAALRSKVGARIGRLF